MSQDPTYSEHLTKRILARAVELDHIRSQDYSLTELRTIATEVGVSEAALEQAMRELRPAPAAQLEAVPRRSRMWLPVLAAGAVLLGLSGGIVDMTTSLITSPLVMGILLMLSGGLAVSQDYSSPRRGWHRFLISNTVLWAVYAIAWSIAASTAEVPRPIATMIMMRIGVVGWALSSAFGSIIALLQRRSSGADVEADAAPPLRRRIAEKVKHWLDIWARRTSVEPTTGDRAAHATLAH